MSGSAVREAVERILAEAGVGAQGQLEVLALGWATVDADRAMRELTERWPELGPFEPGRDDVLLGARTWLARGAARPAAADHGPPVRLVVLEPSSEGRLAASLARRDEGPVAVWLVAGTPGDPRSAVPQPSPGPFGLERLRPGSATWGPHVLLVTGPPGTIDP